jgi:hypothetical protein
MDLTGCGYLWQDDHEKGQQYFDQVARSIFLRWPYAALTPCFLSYKTLTGIFLFLRPGNIYPINTTHMKPITWFAKYLFCTVILSAAVTTVGAQTDSALNLPNFLLPSFTRSLVKFKSGEVKTALLNYNVIDQEMVFRQADAYMVLDDPQLIDTILMDDRKFVPFKVGFYEVALTGPFVLYIQHKINAEDEGTPTGYGATSKSATPVYLKQIYGPTGSINLRIPDNYKLTDVTDYWISMNNSMDKFATKRQFLKLFKDKEKEINQYIDKNNISFKKPADVVKLVTYCRDLK